MREHVYGRRIGQIIRRNVDRLNRGDRSGAGVGDALFEGRQFRTHGRLITQLRGHLPHQSRHFHAGLDETEYLSIKQKHVSMLIVAEVLRHRQRRLADAKAAAGRLVHLTEHHHHVLEHAGGLHVAVQLFAFTAALADPAENADALPMADHVVNHFGEEHCLAHAGSAKQARLSAALQRHQDIDGFDAGLEDFRLRCAIR